MDEVCNVGYVGDSTLNMKWSYLAHTLLAVVVLSVTSSQAAFTIVNKSEQELTLLLDYAYKPYFEIVKLKNDQSTPIQYGLQRIITFNRKGAQRLKKMRDGKRVAKETSLPEWGRTVLRQVSGRVGEKDQLQSHPDIAEDMHHVFTRHVPEWYILSPEGSGGILKLWRHQ